MATFVSTIKFTKRGLAGIRDSVKRSADFQASAKKAGIKVRDVLWTLGPFDGLIVFEAPDDETATAAMLRLALQGNVQTSTSRAFDAAGMKKVVAKMGRK